MWKLGECIFLYFQTLSSPLFLTDPTCVYVCVYIHVCMYV